MNDFNDRELAEYIEYNIDTREHVLNGKGTSFSIKMKWFENPRLLRPRYTLRDRR